MVNCSQLAGKNSPTDLALLPEVFHDLVPGWGNPHQPTTPTAHSSGFFGVPPWRAGVIESGGEAACAHCAAVAVV